MWCYTKDVPAEEPEPSLGPINTSFQHSTNCSKRFLNSALVIHKTPCPIPVVRPETTDADTYDLDLLLDPKVQS